MHVDDLARACLPLLELYDEMEPVDVGTALGGKPEIELAAGIRSTHRWFQEQLA